VDELIEHHLPEAKRDVGEAKRYSDMLKNVLQYARNHHVGMLKSNSELTQYILYLADKIDMHISSAAGQMRVANVPDVPDDLPF